MVIKKQSGFTLLEILVAVAIIGLMVATVGPKVMEQFARGRKGAATSQLSQIKDGLMTYNMDIGRFPNTREGLQVLIENVKNNPKWVGPYLSKEPLDPWGTPYVYNSPVVIFNKKYRTFEIYSYGEHGEIAPETEWIHTGE